MMRKVRGSERTATFLSQFDRRFDVQEYTFRPNVYISSSSLFTSHMIAHICVPRIIITFGLFQKLLHSIKVLTTSFLLYAVNCAVALCVRVICIVGITVSLDVCAFKLRSNACS